MLTKFSNTKNKILTSYFIATDKVKLLISAKSTINAIIPNTITFFIGYI